MAWHRPILRALAAGQSATVCQRGNTMFDRIQDGQLATVSPDRNWQLRDLVFVRLNGAYLLRTIEAIEENRVEIADSLGKSSSWVSADALYGRVVSITTPDDLLSAISVDGIRASPFTIWIHHQTDPFPGGHRYEWEIPKRLVQPLRPLRREDFVTCRSPNHELQTHWLCWLQGVFGSTLRNLACEQPARYELPVGYEFVLNTIEALTDHDGSLTITGICSPFVRSEPK